MAKARKPASTKAAKAKAKPKAKLKPQAKPKAKAKPAPKPTPARSPGAIRVEPKPAPSPDATRAEPRPALSPDAIHVELGAKLASVRGDEREERAAFASAIDAFMKLHASGKTATEVSCAEFLWEGDTSNPPIYVRVADATMDETSRWFQFLVEEKQAYDARVSTA